MALLIAKETAVGMITHKLHEYLEVGQSCIGRRLRHCLNVKLFALVIVQAAAAISLYYSVTESLQDRKSVV